jgi:hypothetical protein
MSIKHLYKQVESGMWEVGYYDPDGYWQPESEHDNANAASQRVHYLNAGVSLPIFYAYLQIELNLVASGLLRSAGAMAERERPGHPTALRASKGSLPQWKQELSKIRTPTVLLNGKGIAPRYRAGESVRGSITKLTRV